MRRLLLAGILLYSSGQVSGARVTSIDPRHIGEGGGTIVIHGDGFATDAFSQFDPSKGNKAIFSNELISVECQNPINWNFLLENPQDPSPYKITCDMPPEPTNSGSSTFSLKLLVDGVEVKNHKTIYYHGSYTPYLRRIKNRYGKPGEPITFYGRIFTKDYGNSNWRDDEGALLTRRDSSITGVVVGDRECQLTDDLGNVYGMMLDGLDSDEGNITCMPGGTFIGPRNLTFVVSGRYGKSVARKNSNPYSVNSNGQMFVYHTLPELTSVQPNVGGTEGGTFLTIRGNSFDSYKDTTQVKIGGAECEPVSIKNDELVCKTPPQSAVTPSDAGTRGLKYEMWVSTEGEGDRPADALSETAGDYRVKTIDGGVVSGSQFGERNGYTAKLSGYLVGPYDGKVSFYLATSGFATLYVSNNSDPANLVQTHRYRNGRSTVNVGNTDHRSDAIEVKKGELYYFEAFHVQKSSMAEENLLQVYFWLYNTYYHEYQSKYVKDELQYINMKYTRNLETQRVTLNNMNSASEIFFTTGGNKARTAFTTDDSENKTSAWTGSFDSMLTVQCNYLNTRHFIKQDYEDSSYKLVGEEGGHTDNVEGYCGKKSSERGQRIWHSYHTRKYIDALRYKWLCFATKGSVYRGRVQILYRWQDTRNRARRDWIYFDNIWTPTEDWTHTCFDWEQGAKNENVSWIAKDMKDNSYLKIEDIYLPVQDTTQYFWKDEVTISETKVEIERINAIVPNSKVIVGEVKVMPVETETNQFDVEINPRTCHDKEDDWPLFGIDGAEIEGLNFDGSSYTDPSELAKAKLAAENEYLSSNENVTFTNSAWGAGTVTIQRIKRGSRKPTGSYTISYKDKSVVLTDFDLTTTKLEAILATEFNMLGVQTYYWNYKCYHKMIRMDWYRATASGDIDLLEMNTTNTIIDNDGQWSNFNFQRGQDGGYHLYEPGGDFFRLKSSSPASVEVRVNGFLSLCSTSDCSFSYNDSVTPALTGVSDSLDGSDVILTITGTGLTTGLDNYVVTVGETPCIMRTTSKTQISCQLAPGPAGTFPVVVIVKNKGLAKQPVGGALQYTVSVRIISNQPSDGSLGGGTTINVTGTGFPGSVEGWQGNSVTIGGNACTVTVSTFTWFTCVTSASTGGSRKRRSASDISISVGGETSSGGSYQYDAGKTPSLLSISPSSGSPLGGGVLTLTGTAFGVGKWGKVKIGDADCPVLSWADTEITCRIPKNNHGDHAVYVGVPDNGFADTTAAPKFSVGFKITDVTPRVGSTLGGTRVRIEGSGFNNCSNITVSFGDLLGCEVTECSDIVILCTTVRRGKVHVVDNGGKHPKYGPGYVWNPTEVVVKPGDTVNWLWTITSSSPDTGINVHQTEGPTVNDYDGKGFSSGAKRQSGNFKETFSAPGTYYYSSDSVWNVNLFMPGRVVVEADDKDSVLDVQVMMTDIPAFHDMSTGSSGSAFTQPDCSIVDISDCATAPVNSDKFQFKSASCLTPVVSSVQISSGPKNSSVPSWGFENSELTISGTGFSSTQCQNQISIGGDHKCTVSSATATSIVCNVNGNPGGEVQPLESLANKAVTVNILNKGIGVMKVASPETAKFRLYPKITSQSLTEGSWAGGSVLTFSGSGLITQGGKDAVLVIFGEEGLQKSCAIIAVTYTEISCLVPDFRDLQGLDTDKTVPVMVEMGYMSENPVISAPLSFTFKASLLATADSMSPSSVTANTPITITGTNFGSDASKVQVFARGKSIDSSVVQSTRRRKRSVEVPQPSMPVEKVKLKFFEQKGFKRDEFGNLIVKCVAGEKHCNFEAATQNIETSSLPREKRDVEREQLLIELEREDDRKLMEEACNIDDEMFDIEECFEMANIYMKLGSHSRRRRSVDEEGLIELSLLTDGSYEGTVSTVSPTQLTVTFPELPAGKYDIIVNIQDGVGNAASSLDKLTSQMSLTSVSPSSGSVHGGQLITITGGGFSGGMKDTTVTIGAAPCKIVSTTPAQIVCRTSNCTESCGDLVVTSNSNSESANLFSYLQSSSPVVTSVSAASSVLTITGTSLGSGATVSLSGTDCTVTSSSDSQVLCTIPDIAGGDYPVLVNNPALGDSNKDVLLTVELSLSTSDPTSGSYGGGTLLTLTGKGFSTAESTRVTVCNRTCEIQEVTTTQIKCLAPSNPSDEASLSCDVSVVQDSGSVSLSSGFTYLASLTPTISSASPLRGGTGGGTLITITGSGFASTGNKVSIDGSVCDISAESSTEISCYTNYHSGAVEAPITVDVPGQGYARHQNITFYYIDRWSSKWSWGGVGTPLAGEFIVITEGQTILLDTDTPVLKFLLINGGTLMFDKDAPNLELQSEYILVAGGGKLIIGTEDEPYQNKATITMHGNVRCTEMPVFGCKVIGIREGSLDLHGKYVPVTWTHLAQTAKAGDTSITLKQPVTWQVGEKIVVATTGDRNSMKESEEHTISAISGDGLTITLAEPLKYLHISIEQTFGGKVVETRAEVALLTRNVVIQGTKNEEFVEVIPACEQEFNSGGAFSDAMQTCFAGKFGEELGSDEMGAVIIISPKYKDQGLVEARISYTELTSVGQAFRVGRYPIHFHVTGNMNTSYVRGNAIHHSNNRACTLHDISNTTVEHNVAFNIKGLTFFLEDGVEMYNILQYNLAIFTRMSNSLLNPDINPASFWIVNPNNKIRHNTCAGGTHLCFWVRPARVPDGPSYTQNFCPYKVPFDEFHNNTAHSMGWYGFWIMGQSNHVNYDPHTGTPEKGYCNGYRTTTSIGSMTTWNNKRGFEIVSGNSIRLEDQIHMDHDFSAYEIFKAKGPYGSGPGIYNSIIVGNSEVSKLIGREDHCTPVGIQVAPTGYTLENITFYNFGTKCAAMQVRIEEAGESANVVRTSGLTFVNTTNYLWIPPENSHSTWFRDIDGSMTGTVNSHIVGKSVINPPECVDDTGVSLGKGTPDLRAKVNDWGEPVDGITGQICDSSVNFHRMVITEPAPSSMLYTKLNIKTRYGEVERDWLKMTEGWQALLVQDSAVNFISFKTSEHLTNISYRFEVYGMHKGENYVLMGHELMQIPDRFTILDNNELEANSSLLEMPTYQTAENGDWFFSNKTDTEDAKVVYILSSKGDGLTNKWRRKRETEETERTGDYGNWPSNGLASGVFRVIRCQNAGCIPTPPPEVPVSRPDTAIRWSNASAWEELNMTRPSSNEEVSIPAGVWIILDEDIPKLRRINIYGALEVEDTADRTIEAEIVFILGGSFIVGRPGTPFTHNFELVLTGNHKTPDQPMDDAANCGAKSLCVYGHSFRDTPIPGYIDMHGVDIGKSWVKLAVTANPGDTTLELVEAVTWPADSEIVISSTSWEYLETERMEVASVSGTTVTLKKPLVHKHLSSSNTLTGGSFSFFQQAEVGLLTRNVKIVGGSYSDQEKEMFGARVLVGGQNKFGTILPGYGRFSNVEFARAGQEGWSDNFDPRYSIAFVEAGDHVIGTGEAGEAESYIKNCGLNYNYNSAIGIFNSHNVGVENNVIYRHIMNGIFDESKGTRIVGNLVTMGEAIQHFKEQPLNMEFYGCVDIKRAEETIFTDNVIAGCAQAGLVTSGSPCSETFTWDRNEIHTSLHAIHLNNRNWFPKDCVKIENFYAWRNWDYGLMSQTEDIVETANLVLVDNGVGTMFHGTGPSADKHEVNVDLHVTIKDSVIVGTSDLYDCNDDKKPYTMEYEPNSKRGWSARFRAYEGKFHHTGVVMPIFMSKYPKVTQAWHQSLKGAAGANPALSGIMYLHNVTFDKFNSRCTEYKDLVIRTNTLSDDVNFPIEMKQISLLDVDEKSKLFINRPLAGKINPADCTDFDCDGMKKALLWDVDGSFKGSPGSIIPDSAFEWDGSPARGLGYYRVPKPMVTRLNGSRIPYAEKMPNTGLYRGDNQCTWNDDWRAYTCTGINHRIMIIESMDRDTKIRRLSPIAMLANPGDAGYIDLVNGPQDFSCCSGYTCAERLSTFFTMVATGIEYELMMTSIPPQNFKFHILHNLNGDAVRVKMWFPKQQRLDIYTEGRYIPPMNKDFTDTKGHTLKPADDKFIPALTDTNCNNYFDPNTGHLYLIVRGPATCDIKTQPVVVLKMGITVDEDSFFDADSIVANIAGLLGIDASNIRVTNIVREGSSRRKRDTSETIDLQFEIAEPPAEDLDESEFVPEEVTYTTPVDPNAPTLAPGYVTSTTTTPRPAPATVDPNKLTFDKLSKIQANIATVFQSGGISAALNVTVSEMKMEDPIPPPEEPPAYTSPEERAQVLETTYAEQVAQQEEQKLEELTEEKSYDVPRNLVLGRQPYEAEEMTPIKFYPYLYFTNDKNEKLELVGNTADPWRVKATLKAGPENATAEGSLTVDVIGGMANFSGLLLSHEGSGYQLTFSLDYPGTINMSAVDSIIFDVGPRPLGVKFEDMDILIPNEDPRNVSYFVWDLGQDIVASAAVLGSQTWQCELSFTLNVPVQLVGSKTSTISQPGAATGYFSLDKFEGNSTSLQFTATCLSPESGRTITGKSNSFIVFPGSSTSSVGLLRKTSLAMQYDGPYQVVQGIVDAFNTTLGTLQCEGSDCPGSGSSSRKKRSVSLARFNPCNMPINMDMSCPYK